MDDIKPQTQFGARLKSARTALRLSEKDAAAHLHLNPKIIHMMENDQFDGVPATFMRGYLRSYAKLLNLEPQEIEAALGLVEQKETPLKVNFTQTPTTKSSGTFTNWITSGITLALAVLVVVWWNSHAGYSESEVKTQQPTPQAVVSPTTATNTAPEAQPPTVAATLPEPSAFAPTLPAAEPPATEAVAPMNPPTTATTNDTAPPVTITEENNATAAKAPAKKPHRATNSNESMDDLAQMNMSVPEPGLQTRDEYSDDSYAN